MKRYSTAREIDPESSAHGKWCVMYRTRYYRIIIKQFDNRSDAQDYTRKCNASEVAGLEFQLCQWEAEGDGLIKSHPVCISPEEVVKLMKIPKEEPPLLCYGVSAMHRPFLLERTKHKINLNKFEYTLETA